MSLFAKNSYLILVLFYFFLLLTGSLYPGGAPLSPLICPANLWELQGLTVHPPHLFCYFLPGGGHFSKIPDLLPCHAVILKIFQAKVLLLHSFEVCLSALFVLQLLEKIAQHVSGNVKNFFSLPVLFRSLSFFPVPCAIPCHAPPIDG